MGNDGFGVIGIDRNPSDPEEVPGVWRGCDRPDGFYGPVCSGCGGRDPVLGITPHTSGCNLTLDLSRLFRKTGQGPAESISNIAVFVPFGFFLAESLASLNRTGTGSWRRVGWVVLAAFGLSLCIECLQLILHVGVFEITDLVMNTLGAFVGALISAGLRKVVGERRHAV